MDCVTHGLQGGLLYALSTKFLFLLFGVHISLWILAPIFIWGIVEGMWPDAFDWYSAWRGWTPRWQLYRIYHTLPVQSKWNGWPAFMLHVKYVDPIFHKKPASISQEVWDANAPGTRNWMKWLWWLALIYWVSTLALLYTLIFI